MAMLRTLAATFLCLMLSTPAWAGMEEAMVAYSQRDYRAALGEFRALASQGDRIAQYRIGKMYYYGQGVPQDYAEALNWYKKAAERDNADALFSVARMYNSGIGVQRDYIEAMKWYRKAAELGHGDSQTHLGLMYFVGMEVSRDHIEALKWLNIASSLGVDVAPRYSDIVAQRMTELQTSEAQRMADDWLAEHLTPK
ncbi:MAG: tetratricopeptide repeat protein [Proteobacteria bacterium]|nr:tetratricopeptide repeat protein [Pseudomonadota bacterium]